MLTNGHFGEVAINLISTAWLHTATTPLSSSAAESPATAWSSTTSPPRSGRPSQRHSHTETRECPEKHYDVLTCSRSKSLMQTRLHPAAQRRGHPRVRRHHLQHRLQRAHRQVSLRHRHHPLEGPRPRGRTRRGARAPHPRPRRRLAHQPRRGVRSWDPGRIFQQ